MRTCLAILLALTLSPAAFAQQKACKDCKPCAEHHKTCLKCDHNRCQACKKHHATCNCVAPKSEKKEGTAK